MITTLHCIGNGVAMINNAHRDSQNVTQATETTHYLAITIYLHKTTLSNSINFTKLFQLVPEKEEID